MTLFNPYVLMGIALACLLSFLGGFGCQYSRNKAAWTAHNALDKAADDQRKKENSDYRNREKLDKIALVDVRKQRDEAIANGKQAADDLAEYIRNNPERVRIHWRVRECDVPKNPAADRGGENLAELQAASIGRIAGIGSEADATHTFLIQRLLQAEKTCGTLPRGN